MESRNQSSVVVPIYQDAEFWKKLAALNKKAGAFHLDPVEIAGKTQVFYAVRNVYSDDDDAVETIWRKLASGETTNQDERIVETTHYDLDYPLIKLGDWRVVAQLENLIQTDGVAGNLVFSVSTVPADVEAAESYRNCPIGCDHCNTARNRKLGYVLADRDGNHRQVGSTCLEDFTGIDPAAALFLARLYEFQRLYDMDGDGWGGSWRPTAIKTRDYVADVLFCIEQWGFVSATKAREEMNLSATYEDAWSLPSTLKDCKHDSPLLTAYRDRLDQRHLQADEVIASYCGQEQAVDGFAANVKMLLSHEMISLERKHLAFVAGAVGGYLRGLEKKHAPQLPSVHVGKVGDKIVGNIMVRSPVVHWDTAFGRAYRVNMRDEAGNLLSWKTSNPPDELCWGESIGRRFNASFKVKAHDEYKNRAVTEVSHLKFKAWVDEPELQAEDQKPLVCVIRVDRMDTDAFVNGDCADVLAGVVLQAAEKVRSAMSLDSPFSLRDPDDIEVGSIHFRDDYDGLGEVQEGGLLLVIDPPAAESASAVTEAIREVAASLKDGMTGAWSLHDKGLAYGRITVAVPSPQHEADASCDGDDLGGMER